MELVAKFENKVMGHPGYFYPQINIQFLSIHNICVSFATEQLLQNLLFTNHFENWQNVFKSAHQVILLLELDNIFRVTLSPQKKRCSHFCFIFLWPIFKLILEPINKMLLYKFNLKKILNCIIGFIKFQVFLA